MDSGRQFNVGSLAAALAAVAAGALALAWPALSPAAGERAASAKTPASATQGRDEIVPRLTPVLKETAKDVSLKIWINPKLPEAEKPTVVWQRAIWGNTDQAYNTWQDKQPWGDGKQWYYTWTDVAWFKDKLVCTFVERNVGHNKGDTILHVIVSEDDGKTWRSVAHYEMALAEVGGAEPQKGALFYGYLCPNADRLMMNSLAGGERGRMMGASSTDGVTWTPLASWRIGGKTTWGMGEIFRPAWHNGRGYGHSRAGRVWRSLDAEGRDWEPIEHKGGMVVNNETASTFVDDVWLVFARSGRMAASRPPYTEWTKNEANYGKGEFGGPNLKALPNGEVVAGSRARIEKGKRGDEWDKPGEPFPTMLYRYDGKELTPVMALPTGSSATAYPGLAWHDGHLWVSQMIPGEGAHGSRGRVFLAKLKWPLEPNVVPVSRILYPEADKGK